VNTKRIMQLRIVLVLVMTGGLVLVAEAQTTNDQQSVPAVQLITIAELKEKFSSNEPVTIIDVRAADSYGNSETRIKGAIHVKLRRLKSRLVYAPLKDVPRDREVVTYCACQGEHSSIVAAQILLTSGFKRVRALKGGWHEWLKASGQVEPKPKG
jgi:rhodanese-related sulfurtransferase